MIKSITVMDMETGVCFVLTERNLSYKEIFLCKKLQYGKYFSAYR